MRPRNIVILVILLVPALAWAIVAYRNTQRRKLHEMQYQAALKSYSSELRLGMRRHEVHDILRNKNVIPSHEPYGGPPLDDFIYLGRMQDLWYCSWENVDIQLEFAASKPNDHLPTPDDSLHKIILSRWPHDCL